MIKKDIHLFTNLSKWMNIFYYCKKSDRVIGNRDLIANPFFQGYSRSDFDWILDHFLAKWSGFDCQSQKKWSVTTMESIDHLMNQIWHSFLHSTIRFSRICLQDWLVVQIICSTTHQVELFYWTSKKNFFTTTHTYLYMQCYDIILTTSQ